MKNDEEKLRLLKQHQLREIREAEEKLKINRLKQTQVREFKEAEEERLKALYEELREAEEHERRQRDLHPGNQEG